MYTYTTPTITCTLSDVNFTNVDYVRIAIKSKNSYVLREIPIADIDTTEGTTTVELTQDETAAFGEGQVKIQARVHFIDDTVLATNKVVADMRDVLDKVVI